LSVLALITHAHEARSVVAAAQNSAHALNTDLVILSHEYSPIVEDAQTVVSSDAIQSELVSQVFECLQESQNRLRSEKSLPGLEAVRWDRHPNPLTTTIEQTRKADIQLIVANAESKIRMPGKQSIAVQALRGYAVQPCSNFPKRTTIVAT